MKPIECYKETSEDWCPSYKFSERGLVKVRLSSRYPINEKENYYPMRVVVSGNDDYMMFYDTDSTLKAMKVYFSVLKLDDVTYEALKELKFEVF